MGLLIGVICGAIGALFSKAVALVTSLRIQNGWLLYLLPISGLLTVILYKALKIKNIGTVQVFNSAKSDTPLPLTLSPAIFIATALTHLCGGSAGKEGAALQIGGGISALLSRILRLDIKKQNTLLLCGMAALFSAVFGTPIAAAVFALEAVRVKKSRYTELLPCLISSLSAYATALLLRVHPERFNIKSVPDFSALMLLKTILIAVTAGIVGVFFCKTLHYTSKISKKLIKNDYIRIFVGGCAVILITLIIGTRDYNGSSIEILCQIFENEKIGYEAFVLKLILTAVTMGFGYKGGEIIPSLFIGAALGGAISLITGLAVPFGAAIGMAALFCSVTKCPLASVLLCFELFSSKAILYLSLSVIISLLISGRTSLYGDTEHIIKRILNKSK